MSDTEELIHCPYNFSHIILKPRMAVHLIKCRQQHSIQKFKTCPFNSTHDIPAPEVQYHIQNCPDRKNVENYIYVVDEAPIQQPKIEVEVPVPSVSENWDEEECVSGSYLNIKNEKLEKELVFRQPVGLTKANRKAFFKSEVNKFSNTEESKN